MDPFALPVRTRTRGASRLLAVVALCVAAAAGSVFTVPALALAQPASDPLDQTIDADQPVATGPAVLDDGHVDIGPRFVDGEWRLMVHDDSVIPSVWRSLDDAVIHVADAALQAVPDDPTYGFLGVAAGAEVHVVPQVQRPGVVWVGWNTQDPEVMARADRGASLTLLGVEGPGEMTMYLQAGNLSAPDVLWRSTVAERQPIWVEVNTHTHANWVFTEPGVYLVQVEVAAELIDGTTASDVATLRFAVGDATSVSEARTATYAGPIPPPPDAGAAGSGTTSGDDGGTAAPVVAIVAAGAAILVVAVGVAVARSGSAKRRAEREHAARAGETGSSR